MGSLYRPKYRASDGVPLWTIAQVLGHRDLRMTVRYAHLAPEFLKQAMTALERASR
jgi:site-specific recombinase XerD